MKPISEPIELKKAIAESEFAQRLLETKLSTVYERIKSLVGNPIWDQQFVAKLLHCFEKCLVSLDADYETIDLLTSHYYEQLPDVNEEF